MRYRVLGQTGPEIEMLALQAAADYGLDLDDVGLSIDYELSPYMRTMTNAITMWEAEVSIIGILRSEDQT